MSSKTHGISECSGVGRQVSEQEIFSAANMLKQGQLVIFPTETVYGIGAAASNEEALSNIFKVKGRPQDNPLILHVSDLKMLRVYAKKLSAAAEFICKTFMPGPLTVILPKSDMVNDKVTAGLDTVGIRIPSNAIARSLIVCAGEAIAAPSANISGKPSPTDFQAVLEDFAGTVPCIIDGGDSVFGVESTIVDLSNEPFRILRPGAVSAEQINTALATAGFSEQVLCRNDYYLPDADDDSAPKAPGMKYRHYAPEAEVKIIRGDFYEKREYLMALLNTLQAGDFEHEYSQIQDTMVTAAEYTEADNSDCVLKNSVVCTCTGHKVSKVSVYLSDRLYRSLPEECVRRIDKVFLFEDFADHTDNLHFKPEGEALAFRAANGLFAVLRDSDRSGMDLIAVEALDGRGMAQAFMNRLSKAETK